MDNKSTIEYIIKNQKDYDLLPRDEDGYCVYDGDFDCNGSWNEYDIKITKLPDYLKVIGYFDCGDNELTELPKGLITSSLNCSYNQLTSIPDNLYVGHSLNCSHNDLTSLPKGLKVGGDLNCSYNQLTSIPDNLYVGHCLYCQGNNIVKEIKANIGGKIKMDDEQQKIYNRVLKLNRIKGKLNG